MSLVSFSIPNLINGISQQAFTLRLASQGQEQLNGLSSVVDGLKKRPPAQHVSKLSNNDYTSCFLHTINRDKNEQYEVIIGNGTIEVYDLSGNRKVVNTPNGIDYIRALNPRSAFSCVTVADYTFIVNKEVTVQQSAQRSPKRTYEAMIWVRQGAYDSEYKIEVADVTGTFTTPNAGYTALAGQTQTTYIAQKLADSVRPGLTAIGINIQVIGSVLYITSSTADFRVAVFDPLGDTALKLVKGGVQRFSDLPAKSPPGFTVKVAGTSDSNFDDYWVSYEAADTNPFGGIWKESVKGDIPISLDNATMPHLLVRDADGTFSFEEAVFDPRKVGDLDSNPWPSFVGQKISDAFFHRNRLGFLSDENIVMSQAGEFFKFFRSSAIQVLDTDPIDVAVSHVKVSLLRAAVPYNETLILFSDQTQFQLGKAELLTPKTISVNVTTEFACDLSAKPVAMGTNVYFTQVRGATSSVREYYLDPDTATNDAADITSHCPKYIPGKIIKFAATSNEDMLVALSDADPSSIYVYRLHWDRQQKLQSSWSRWSLPVGSTILNADFIESKLLLVVSRADGTYLEKIDLGAVINDDALPFQVLLDRRVTQATTGVSLSYDAATNRTRMVLPYQLPEGVDFSVIATGSNAVLKPGSIVPIVSVERTTPSAVTVKGNLSSFTAGCTYLFRYVFSPLMVREQAPGGRGAVSVTEGRVQVRKMSVAYANTGYFQVEVTPSHRDTYRYTFSGRVVGSIQNVLGQVSLETGTFQFPVASKNDTVEIALVNSLHLPCAFLSADWEAFFVIRSRRGG